MSKSSLIKLTACGLFAMLLITVQAPTFNAFEAHVINVLATIENNAPRIDPPNGQLCAPETGIPDAITITAPPIANAELVYSVDGSDPDCTVDPHHASPTSFYISGPHTIKARTCYDGNQSSIISLDMAIVDCNQVPVPYCGDNTVDAGEQCDDGNTEDGDGCSASCQDEIPEPGDVVINEFIPNPDGSDNAPMTGGEWVELYNRGGTAVDVDGWVLYDSDDTHELYITASNTDTGDTIVTAGGWLVVYRDGDGDFAMNNADGDSVRLFDGYPPASSNLIDSYTYTSSAPSGKSYARIPDGSSNWVDPIPTPGAPNILEEPLVLIENLIISETPTSTPTSTEPILPINDPPPADSPTTTPIITGTLPINGPAQPDSPTSTEPIIEPLIELPPVDPPVEDPPTEDPPVEEPPTEDPPVEEPPAEDPPVEEPPAEDPPVEDPPIEETPPVEDPPTEPDPPVEEPVEPPVDSIAKPEEPAS